MHWRRQDEIFGNCTKQDMSTCPGASNVHVIHSDVPFFFSFFSHYTFIHLHHLCHYLLQSVGVFSSLCFSKRAFSMMELIMEKVFFKHVSWSWWLTLPKAHTPVYYSKTKCVHYVESLMCLEAAEEPAASSDIEKLFITDFLFIYEGLKYPSAFGDPQGVSFPFKWK